MPAPLSDELLARAARGDAEARSELVEPWLRPETEWATRLSGPRVDPEDVAHEVFVVALTKLHAVHDSTKFPAWLYSITRKVIAKHHRRTWLKRWAGAPQTDLRDEAPGPMADAVRRESDLRVRTLLAELPMKQREVVVLVCIEERSAVEVAELLGVPEGTVRSRLRLAKKRLLERAERLGFDGGQVRSAGSSAVGSL